MKKLIYIFILLAAFKAEAQKSVMFNMKYLPMHDYDGVMNTTVNIKADLSGNDEIIEKLKSQGITMPLDATVGITINANSKTGAMSTAHIFPLLMSYKFGQISVNLSGKTIPLPSGVNKEMLIYGHVNTDGKIKADSLNGNKSKDTTGLEKINQLMNSIQNRITFPDHPLHVGDTFIQDMPLNLPMTEGSTGTSVKVTYKLTSIADGKAYFDMTENADVQIKIKEAALNMTGTGTGKLIYSIKDNYLLDYSTLLNLNINGNFNTLIIKGTLTMNSDFKYTIN